MFEKNLPARNIELNITRDDGISIFLSINATPLFDCNHQVTGVVASIIDITERIKNEQKNKGSKQSFTKNFRLGMVLPEY
ncbi:PAS domain-containing protein [Anaerobacillus sp. HL2]|nr:PAS domain-containing protein [Anaerobacillus sp. HL2]